MRTTGPDSRLYVVVGVIQDRQNRLLIQQRMTGKDCAGKWEFPGGKLERGEKPESALVRELEEELGLQVTHMEPLTQVAHDYEHARVWLDVYMVTRFEGTATGLEGQDFAWMSASEIGDMDILDPVLPILDAIRTRNQLPNSEI